MAERCKKEVFDGWEDTDRCLLDKHGKDAPHNFIDPSNAVERKRFDSNEVE